MHNVFSPSKAGLFPVVFWVVVLTSRGAFGQEGFEGWNLEPGVGQAHLVMVARVESISRLTVVEGAKTDVALREYRFQPVRILKGLFQRDQLSMTASDLGLSPENAASAPPLKEGELRMLILAQQRGLTASGGILSYGCVSAVPGATTFEQRVPLLKGPDDPLVSVIETLIHVADSRSRSERAKLLIDRLLDTNGVAAVPLLTSLQLRADWAATDARAYTSLTRLLHEPQSAVRGTALAVLRDMLASRILLDDPPQLEAVANALCEVLESKEAVTSVRLAALEALGNLLVLKPDVGGARELLITLSIDAATYAERAAAVTALSQIGYPQATGDAYDSVMDAVAGLPLDESPPREAIYARAALRLLPNEQAKMFMGDPPAFERVLLERLKRSLAARQSLAAEIDPLGRTRCKQSLPLLLEAAGKPFVVADDRLHIARALGRLGDDQAVHVLVDWFGGNNYQLKAVALAALEEIDSPLAAREARPLLKSEANLSYKLRIARLLARHGLDDGYALATEHLADDQHTSSATLVLVALDDPRTTNDLSAVLASQPDRRWRAAALTGLAAIGNAAAQKQLLEILADDRNPLTADAARAAGLTDDSRLLLPLAKLVQSRNKQIAQASLLALRRYLSGVRTSPRGLNAVSGSPVKWDNDQSVQPAAEISAETRAALAESVAALVADTYVESRVRGEALAVAKLIGGENYHDLLTELADQAELEGTPLLAIVRAERRRLAALKT